MRLFTLARVLAVALLLGFAPQIAFSQGDPNTENGFKLYGSYDGTTMDTVNLMNGNLTLHIPLPFYFAQRGAKLDPRYFLVENSKNWTVGEQIVGNNTDYFWTYAGATGRVAAEVGLQRSLHHRLRQLFAYRECLDLFLYRANRRNRNA